MAEASTIEWTKSTFGPWIGCTKVGPGCDHCYAERMDARGIYGGQKHWGPGVPRYRTGAANWNQVRRWNRQAPETEFAGRKGFWPVFSASQADIFDNEVPEEWRADFWALVRECPNLTFQIVTKRIGNVPRMLPADWGNGYPNVWLLSTIVNQEEADRDIPKLLSVPAVIHGLSMEPLLGPVDLLKWLDPWTCADCEFHGSENDCGPDGCDKCGENDTFSSSDVCKNCGADDQSAKPSCPNCGSHRSFERDNGFKFDSERKLIDWVIVGGESGNNARPMHLDWARSVRDQCQAAGIAFHFKQFGEWAPSVVPTSVTMERIGKRAAGRLLDGRTWDEYPEVAR